MARSRAEQDQVAGLGAVEQLPSARRMRHPGVRVGHLGVRLGQQAPAGEALTTRDFVEGLVERYARVSGQTTGRTLQGVDRGRESHSGNLTALETVSQPLRMLTLERNGFV